MSSILDFCAAYLPANNLRRISTIYLRGYWKGSENGRGVTIDLKGTHKVTSHLLEDLYPLTNCR